MLNRVILIGRLARDPELRYTPAGNAVASFAVAVDRPFNGQAGEKEVDFINIVTWNKLAETCANYLKKGRLAAVEGRLQVRNYDNNEGRKVYVTEVVAENVRFLDGGSKADGTGREDSTTERFATNVERYNSPTPSRADGKNTNPFADMGRPVDLADDDLPF